MEEPEIIIRSHIVPDDIGDTRFSDYAKDLFGDLLSRKAAKEAIKRGDIRINGMPAPTGSWLAPGMRIELLETSAPSGPPYRRVLPVVYEDDRIAVINKPAGLPVKGNRFKTVENALPGNIAPSPDPDALPRARAVHRLDAQTGGLLLVAKTARAMAHLGRQFEQRVIRKRYRAVAAGKLEGEGIITLPIENREAITRYTALSHSRSPRNGYLTLVDLHPETGRTHQLRIHLAGLGHPIMGDPLYGEPGNILLGKGLFLQAVEIALLHPLDGRELVFSIEQPQKFATLIRREEMKWNFLNSV